MMDQKPPPLTPPECDLRDFPRMMLDITRLRSSTFDATLDDTAWRAGINLWLSAFHSVPAASLDNDEGVLCKAAGLNRDVKTWRKIRNAAMRGFILCSDGRWYHDTLSEFVLEAWIEKLGHRLSSGAGNAKRWKTKFDAEPIKADISNASALLAGLNPASKAIQKASRHISRSDPAGIETSDGQDGEIIQTGSQGKGQGKGEGILPFERSNGPKPVETSSDKPDWWPKLDKYGRITSEITDKIIFDVGKALLGKSSGGQIARLLKVQKYQWDRRAALDLLMQAEEKSTPSEWFAKCLHSSEMNDPPLSRHEVFPETEYRV